MKETDVIVKSKYETHDDGKHLIINVGSPCGSWIVTDDVADFVLKEWCDSSGNTVRKVWVAQETSDVDATIDYLNNQRQKGKLLYPFIIGGVYESE